MGCLPCKSRGALQLRFFQISPLPGLLISHWETRRGASRWPGGCPELMVLIRPSGLRRGHTMFYSLNPSPSECRVKCCDSDTKFMVKNQPDLDPCGVLNVPLWRGLAKNWGAVMAAVVAMGSCEYLKFDSSVPQNECSSPPPHQAVGKIMRAENSLEYTWGDTLYLFAEESRLGVLFFSRKGRRPDQLGIECCTSNLKLNPTSRASEMRVRSLEIGHHEGLLNSLGCPRSNTTPSTALWGLCATLSTAPQ